MRFTPIKFRPARLRPSRSPVWSIDKTTKLQGFKCRYFFLSEKENERTGERERRPHGEGKVFEDGDFEKLFARVQDTIDLLVRKGVDRVDFAHAMRTMMSLYPETQGTIRSVEQVEGDLIVRLNREADTDAAGIEQTFYEALDSRRVEGARGGVIPANPVDAAMVKVEPVERAGLFISYAHDDKRRFKECRQHLTALERGGMAEVWHDERIREGDEWEAAIDERLAKADIILLLISPAFLASKYCYRRELPAAMARRPAATVIPVLVEPCDVEAIPLNGLQLARQGKAISESRNRNTAWTEVTRAVREAIVERRGDAATASAGGR